MEINISNVPVYEKAASAPSTPTEVTKVAHSHSNSRLKRGKTGKEQRVSFPSDDMIVTSYFDAPIPWKCSTESPSADEVVTAYRKACAKQGVKPLGCVVEQLQNVEAFDCREIDLILKGEKLTSKHCETLEEVFKRVQFQTLDLEACGLDDEGSAAVFDMIEYYESASNLNISFNKHIDLRGWQSCSRMLRKTPCIHYLDARNSGLNDQSLLILGRALRLGSSLITLHLESSGLNGRSLVILMAALKLNNTLKELYLGDNKISSADGLQVGNLLRANSWLEMLDLRNNNLQDLGMCHILDGLTQQPTLGGSGLQTLVLWNNQITSNGMKHMVHSLSQVKNMKTLNLGNNNLGNSGIQQLKQALMCNRTLANLGLQNTKITCEGAVAIAEYIAENKHITRIDLRENKIQVGGLMALSLSLKHNWSLTHLDLDQVTQQSHQNYDATTDHCKHLQEITGYCKRNKDQKEHQTWNTIKSKPDLSESLLVKTSHQTSLPDPVSTSCNGIVQQSSTITAQQSDIGELKTWENNSEKNSASHKSSLLTMRLSQSSPIPVLSKSRFRVSQVFLEKEGEKTPVKELSSSAPPEISPLVGQTVITDLNISKIEDLHSINGLSLSLPISVAEVIQNDNSNLKQTEPTAFLFPTNNSPNHSVLDQVTVSEMPSTLSVPQDSVSVDVLQCATGASECVSGHCCQGSTTHLIEIHESSLVESDSDNTSISKNTILPETVKTKEACGFLPSSNKASDDERVPARVNETVMLPCQPEVTENKRTVNTFQEYNHPVLEGFNGERNDLIMLGIMGKESKNPNFFPPESTSYLRVLHRRLSSPVVSSTSSSAYKPPALNLKFCKRLECLDLRSSVPLSPTRLMEGIVFPDPPLTMK
ncbi:uncharacterized protein LOC143226822 [Tachypleus tridentatus]|uniref:uncharacterized protein LOC143226822 n=1 Tax=Tachypleus tridentatus TaxID=6853 RepID=UPI003FD24171